MSAFMYFSNDSRAKVKEDNPGEGGAGCILMYRGAGGREGQYG